jgi:hypothetical protein
MIFQSEEIDPPYQDSNFYEDHDRSLDEEQSYRYQLKYQFKFTIDTRTDTRTSSSQIVPVTTPKLPPYHLQAIYKITTTPFSVEISFEVDPNITAYQVERKTTGTTGAAGAASADSLILKQITPIEPSGNPDSSSTRSITYNDYQVQENTEYTYTVTVYDARDSFFRKDISVELPGTIHPASNKEAVQSGCFIGAMERKEIMRQAIDRIMSLCYAKFPLTHPEH